MGALFRIRFLQYWFIGSLLIWHGIELSTIILPLQPQELQQYIWALLPASLSILIVLAYLIWRKTVMLPLFLAISAGWYVISTTGSQAIHLYWFFTALVLVAYPFFYYKFQDFKLMVAMFRWLVFIASIALAYTSIAMPQLTHLPIWLIAPAVGLLVLGNLALLIHRYHWPASLMSLFGLGILSYEFSIQAHWELLYITVAQAIGLFILYYDPFTRELSPFYWVRYPYFRVVMFMVIVAVVVPWLDLPTDQLASWVKDLWPQAIVNS